MARGRVYEMAFRIGGRLAASFSRSTGLASKRIALLQRQSERLARQQRLTKAWRGVGRSFGNVRQQVGTLARQLTMVSVAAGGGLFLIAKSTADLGDKAIKTSQNLGMEVEALQELWYAAQRSGASQDDMSLALRQMQVQLGQAVQGTGEAQRYLDQLGLSAEALAHQKPEEAFATLADAIRQLPTAAEKAAASQSLFGRGAKKLGVLLDEGSEGLERLRKQARLTGGILGRGATQNGAKFNDQLLILKLSFGGLITTIGVQLLPLFTRLFEKLATWLASNQARVKELAAQFVAWLEASGPRLRALGTRIYEVAEKAWDLIVVVKDMVGGWDDLAVVLAAIRFAPIVAGVVNLAFALGAASWAAWSFTVAMLANPITWIVLAILAEIAVITAALVYWDRWTAALGEASTTAKVLLGVLGWLTLPFWILPALIVLVIHYWDELGAVVRAVGTVIARFASDAWEKVEAAAGWIWAKWLWVWGGVKLVILAAVDVLMLVVRPIVAIIGQLVRWKLAVLSLVWDTIQPAVAAIVGFFAAMADAVWAVLSWLFGLAAEGMATMASALSAIWDRWSDDVIATVRWVAAQIIGILAAPLRLGLALASLVPAEMAPHLAELTSTVGGGLDRGIAAVEGGGPKPLGESSAALAGAMRQREQGRQVSAPLSVDYRPQITLSGSEANKGGVADAIKKGNDDLLERLQAAQEQQQRLAYG